MIEKKVAIPDIHGLCGRGISKMNELEEVQSRLQAAPGESEPSKEGWFSLVRNCIGDIVNSMSEVNMQTLDFDESFKYIFPSTPHL